MSKPKINVTQTLLITNILMFTIIIVILVVKPFTQHPGEVTHMFQPKIRKTGYDAFYEAEKRGMRVISVLPEKDGYRIFMQKIN